jgi:Rap1a immunity proteins
MSKLSIAAIVTCLIATATPSRSQDTSFDTFKLIDWCRQPNGTYNRALCLGYVHAMGAAIARGLVVLRVNNKPVVLELANNVVCIAQEATAEQIAAVFLLFTEQHPELLHKHPSILLAQAIGEAFPCPGK